ncbi:MAG TPA: copper chaperone [Desulfocapsa sulfexigens]|nr:copper chaperone [Desulfocapsa sulfexigens]
MIKTIGYIALLTIFLSVTGSSADEWEVKFRMAGMDSPTTGKKVEGFISDLYGVEEVDLNLPDNSVTVTFESSDIDLDTLKDKIVQADFSITKTIPLKEG